MFKEKSFSFSKMDLYARVAMHKLLKEGLPKSTVAKRLGIHRSTIYRELAKYSTNDGVYDPLQAHLKAINPRKRGTALETGKHRAIRNYVVEKLKEGWSPQQIAGYLEIAFGYRTVTEFVSIVVA